IHAGYNGIEIHLPADTAFKQQLIEQLNHIYALNSNFLFIPQQLISPENETVDVFIQRMKKELKWLTSLQPTYIHSHTGKDFYSFDDNCKIIEASLSISINTGVRILHETHRGRFSFHAASLVPYLKKFPELELVGDFSHFCAVSESLLYDQEELLSEIIPHVSHIHARIGFEQGPQVNDPFAPEWQNHFARFEGWWQQIVDLKRNSGWQQFNITPEFGPAPYMPLLPFTKQPIGNQWEINKKMMEHLKIRL
ncbi:MAG: sugar phosphate isomerase/epimerase, partial [Chitinophagaceae bacterium]